MDTLELDQIFKQELFKRLFIKGQDCCIDNFENKKKLHRLERMCLPSQQSELCWSWASKHSEKPFPKQGAEAMH